MMKPKAMIVVLIVGLLFSESAVAERTVMDMAGRTVTIPDTVCRVFPVGHLMPMALAVAPDRVAVVNRVGEDFERFSPASFRLAKVGVGSASPERVNNPNLPRKKGIPPEDVERVKPDLILMEGNRRRAERADELQKRTGVPVVVVDQSMHRYEEAFHLLARIYGDRIQEARMSGYLMKYLHPIHERTRDIPPEKRVRYYYAHGPDGFNTEPEGNNHVQPMAYLHAVNIFQDKDALTIEDKKYAVTLEEILRLKPDVVLVASMGADKRQTWSGIRQSEKWKQVEAVRKGLVYQVPWLPYSWLDRPPGSNRILGTIWLAKTWYPDLFQDLDLTEAIRQYFEIFFHKTISSEDVADLLAMVHPDGP